MATATTESNGAVFHGLLFCSTGVAPDERELLGRLIQTAGGNNTDALLDTTTHLIVGRVGTTKHVAAARHPGIACVAGDFVRDSVAAGKLLDSSLFAPPPLAGLDVCILANTNPVRSQAEKRVRQLGGFVVTPAAVSRFLVQLSAATDETERATLSPPADLAILVEAIKKPDPAATDEKAKQQHKRHALRSSATVAMSPQGSSCAAPPPHVGSDDPDPAVICDRAMVPIVTPGFIDAMKRAPWGLAGALAANRIASAACSDHARIRPTLQRDGGGGGAAANAAADAAALSTQDRLANLRLAGVWGQWGEGLLREAVEEWTARFRPVFLIVSAESGAARAEHAEALRRAVAALPGSTRVPILCEAVTHVLIANGASDDAPAMKSALAAARFPPARVLTQDWLTQMPARVSALHESATAAADAAAVNAAHGSKTVSMDGRVPPDASYSAVIGRYFEAPPADCIAVLTSSTAVAAGTGNAGAQGAGNTTTTVGRSMSPVDTSRGSSPGTSADGGGAVDGGPDLRIGDIVRRHERRTAVASRQLSPEGSPVAGGAPGMFPGAPVVGGGGGPFAAVPAGAGDGRSGTVSVAGPNAPPRSSGKRRITKLHVAGSAGVKTIFARLHVTAHQGMNESARHELDFCLKQGGGSLASAAAAPPQGCTGVYTVMPHADQLIWGRGAAASGSRGPGGGGGGSGVAKAVVVEWFVYCLDVGELVNPDASFVFTTAIAPRDPNEAQSNVPTKVGGGPGSRVKPLGAIGRASAALPSPYLASLRNVKARPGVSPLIATGDGFDAFYRVVIADLGGNAQSEFVVDTVTHFVLPMATENPETWLDSVRESLARVGGPNVVVDETPSKEKSAAHPPLSRSRRSKCVAGQRLLQAAAAITEGVCVSDCDADVSAAGRTVRFVTADWIAASARTGYFVAEDAFLSPMPARAAAVVAVLRDGTSAAAAFSSKPAAPSSCDASVAATCEDTVLHHGPLTLTAAKAGASSASSPMLLCIFVGSTSSPEHAATVAAFNALIEAGRVRKAESVHAADVVVVAALHPRESLLIALCLGKLLARPELLTDAKRLLLDESSATPETAPTQCAAGLGMDDAAKYAWSPSALPPGAKSAEKLLAESCIARREAHLQHKPRPFAGLRIAFWGVDAAKKLATVVEAGGATVVWPDVTERGMFKEVAAVVHAVKDSAVTTIVCSTATWKAGCAELTEAIGKLSSAAEKDENGHAAPKVRAFDTDWILRTINRKHTEPLLSRRLVAGNAAATARAVVE